MADRALLEGRTAPSDAEMIRAIQELLDARVRQSMAYGEPFQRLWMLASQLITTGKLLRPRLLIGAFDAVTLSQSEHVEGRESAFRIAAAIEVLHYAFLLHDDVIDEDLRRRGAPNLIGALADAPVFAAAAREPEASGTAGRSKTMHWARSSAILLGDLLLAAAHQAFAREPGDVRTRHRLLDVLDDAITESVVGEHTDVSLSDGMLAPDLGTVLSMARLKTATYSFELPLRAAMIIAGMDEQTEETVARVGRHLGTAFQLQDDLLSVFGDPARHGKDPHSDLRERKETAITAYARMTAAWRDIEASFGDSRLGEGEAHRLEGLLRACGAEQFIRSLIDDQMHACAEVLTSADIPAPLSRFLTDACATLHERES